MDRQRVTANLNAPHFLVRLNKQLRDRKVTWNSIVERGVRGSEYDGIVSYGNTLHIIYRPSLAQPEQRRYTQAVFFNQPGDEAVNRWFSEMAETPHDYIPLAEGVLILYEEPESAQLLTARAQETISWSREVKEN